MKRVGYITDKDGRRITLLEAMGDYGNVQKAYNKARKCKRHRKDVLIFTKDKEENLDKVREDIINLAYEPSKYHYFKVYEPKERQIMALPFYDRVVQHAINNVLEPIFDKRFISQSYACRKGKGMHAASDTLKEWLYEWNKYHPDQPLYAIKSWTDAASQLGAFTSLENAKSACKAGYTVYDDNGKAVYTAVGQQTSAGVPFSVQVDILDLNIRTGAGTNYAKTGETTGKGVFTIVEVKAGQGASAGWGRLKSGAGWISLDYATRLA